MTLEKWLIQPGQTRVIDLEDVRKLKIGLVGGQVDVVAHDEPGVRIEVHSVTVKDLRIEADGSAVEIPRGSKDAVAAAIWTAVAPRVARSGDG